MAVVPDSCPTCGLKLADGVTECPHCNATTTDLGSPFPSIRGYQTLRSLGEGGMGAVHLARDQTLGRRVAIKVVAKRHAAEREAATRFLREARSMATVEHPHIVRIYSFGEIEGQPYLVMEYVEGEDLSQRIRGSGPLAADEALRILRQAVEALAAAWEHQIVHRDIKPSNILLDRRGEVRVADFGLAKPMELDAAVTLTAHGYLLGTPHYVSPEQARGRNVDFRSDIYSLGIVLYEMLTGTRPFEGTTPFDVVEQQVHAPLPPLKKMRHDAPESLAQLVAWMTEKDPARRPPSYAALLQRFDELRGARPLTPLTPVSAEEALAAAGQAPFWQRPAAALGVVALYATAAVLGWMNFIRKPTAESAAQAGRGLVVAVAPFYGPDEESAREGKVMAALAEKAVAQRLGRHGAKVLGVEETKQPVRDHEAARARRAAGRHRGHLGRGLRPARRDGDSALLHDGPAQGCAEAAPGGNVHPADGRRRRPAGRAAGTRGLGDGGAGRRAEPD